MTKTIIIKRCDNCPFNYDMSQCVAADGGYYSGVGKIRTVKVVGDGFPENCPLKKGEIVVRK